MDAGEMPAKTASSSVAKPPPRLKYVHPVDLLLTRLRIVLEYAGDLVAVTLGNFEFECQMPSPQLRANAYCVPSERSYPKAREALKLAVPTAVGIGDWLC